MTGDLSRGRVRAYYDGDPDRESRRLQSSWLEWQVTRHFIDIYLEPAAVVLDIGGGPGAYAIDLARAGHTVDLVDLSSGCIALAQQKARERGVRLRSAAVADAFDLRGYDTDAYDLVLCLGPLYHLLDSDDRAKAVHEAIRVARPGAVLFFAFLSRYAPVYFEVKTAPETVAEMEPTITSILASDIHSAETTDDGFFTDAYFADPATIASSMSDFGLDELCVFGAEGGLAQSEAALLDLDGDTKARWLHMALQLATTAAGLYGSEHVVYVGRKTR